VVQSAPSHIEAILCVHSKTKGYKIIFLELESISLETGEIHEKSSQTRNLKYERGPLEYGDPITNITSFEPTIFLPTCWGGL
jgi:hypothetical protein